MIRRFWSHDIPRAHVQANFQNQKAVTQADEEEHFCISIELREPTLSDKLWHDIDLTLVNPPGPTTNTRPLAGYWCRQLKPNLA